MQNTEGARGYGKVVGSVTDAERCCNRHVAVHSHYLPFRLRLPMQLFRMAAGVLTALVLDQMSKIAIVQWLDLRSVHVIPVVPPYLVFAMAWNEGTNFGLLSQYGNRWALVAFSVAISLALAAWARTTQGRIVPLAIGFVVGGALGNALDRVAYGAVADFLNMSCCGIKNPYSFNIADIFVFIGLGLLLVFGQRTGPAA
jgi:signal peptidase II